LTNKGIQKHLLHPNLDVRIITNIKDNYHSPKEILSILNTRASYPYGGFYCTTKRLIVNKEQDSHWLY